MEVQTETKETKITLEDITLEGVPMIRSIANDLLVDVLLYLSQRYFHHSNEYTVTSR
jgi:hypothetical protein